MIANHPNNLPMMRDYSLATYEGAVTHAEHVLRGRYCEKIECVMTYYSTH